MAALAIILLSLAGCGLFEPRDVELPGSVGLPWIPPTEPESVLVNIKNSMEEKILGNYEKSFTEDFVFHPDPADSVDLSDRFPAIFDNWDLDVERTVTQNILDQSASLRLTFTEREAPTYVGADERVYYEKYELQIIFKSGLGETYRGFVDYHMRREGGLWYIFMWLDKRDPEYSTFSTWGYLKGTKRSQ
jgi:hypothetical protein